MKNLFLAALIFCLGSEASAQVTYSSASLERFSTRSGAFILWYGYDGKATQYASFTVQFDETYSEQYVVNELKEKVYTSNQYLTYEFKENFGCNDVYAYIARSTGMRMNDVKDLRFGNCTDMSFQYLKEAPAYDEAVYNQLKPEIDGRERALLADGWVKVYEDYASDFVAAELTLKPGYSYTALSAIHGQGEGDLSGRLSNFYNDISYGERAVAMSDKKVVIELNDFQPPQDLEATYFLVDGNGGTVEKSCLVIYEKPVDFKRDFYRLLDARQDGFKSVKGAISSENEFGYPIYYSTIGLGYPVAKINETDNVTEYIMIMDMMNPATLRFLDNLIPQLQDFPAQGYLSEEYENDAGGFVTEISKDGEQVILIASYSEKNLVYFYIYKDKS